MGNWRKSVLFLFLAVFVMSLGVSVSAEEDDESNQADPQFGFEQEAVSYAQQAQAQKQEAFARSQGAESVQTVSQAASSAIQRAPSVEQPEDSVPAAEQSAPAASGLLELSSYKYPVYVFAPRNYRTDRTYPLIMIAPAESEIAQNQIDYLTGLAERRGIFLLAPYVLWPKSGTTPYQLDEWLLTVKKDVCDRVPINKKKIYLIGKGSGAEYAAYLATKYPQAFSAAALLGEAWDGRFSKLIEPKSAAEDQVPFYIALNANTDAEARNQAWLDLFQKKGYLLNLVSYQNEEALTGMDFKKSVFEWLEANSQSWADVQKAAQAGWKSKVKKGIKDFFAV